ncbi:MAG TPA: hypothetical protein VLL06_04590 [Nitrospiraceae bacterium]|nr:hypothetical protein [Nitrospiraceae bacterium]
MTIGTVAIGQLVDLTFLAELKALPTEPVGSIGLIGAVTHAHEDVMRRGKQSIGIGQSKYVRSNAHGDWP